MQDLEDRDELDTERAHSPLRPASNAVLVDTEGIDVDQVMERLLRLVGEE